MIVGTIYNMMKMTQLNDKFKEKKNELSKKHKNKEITPEERKLQNLKKEAERIRESNTYAAIDSKVQAGATLTKEEIDYLKKNNPEALRNYEDVKREKAAYEAALKNCKTKEDVDRVRLNKIGKFMNEIKATSSNPNIPKAKKLEIYNKLNAELSNITDAHNKFVKSSNYTKLSTDEEENHNDIEDEKEDVSFLEVKEEIDDNTKKEKTEVKNIDVKI